MAANLGWRFTDADDFHAVANIAKMDQGSPLDDGDPQPWRQRLFGAEWGSPRSMARSPPKSMNNAQWGL
ncbi:hypothetical protein [Neosynechococcus sphagnicola]|uniref:hypothetical protein n=1 Tax=Neosynechococcus sphagnicola TaxID=1501145 RepID=UPI0012E0AF89|nr:hypothetical protein [Neosynechococcus sphagnicola]